MKLSVTGAERTSLLELSKHSEGIERTELIKRLGRKFSALFGAFTKPDLGFRKSRKRPSLGERGLVRAVGIKPIVVIITNAGRRAIGLEAVDERLSPDDAEIGDHYSPTEDDERERIWNLIRARRNQGLFRQA